MHDSLDWLSGVIVPGITGLGAVVVGIASLRIAQASNRLTKEVAARDAARRDWQARVEFGE